MKLYISMNAIVKFSLVGIFTIRNSSCGNVMFSHLSVILFTGGIMCGRWACVAGDMRGRGHAWQGGKRARGEGACVHGRRDVHCSGRYASYWNAFLLPVVTSHSPS